MTPDEKAAIRHLVSEIEAKLATLNQIVDEAKLDLPTCAYCHGEITEIPTLISPPRKPDMPKHLLFHPPSDYPCLRMAGSNAMRRGEDCAGEAL